MDGLSLEAQFEHRKFLSQVENMNDTQMRTMLGVLHLSWLGHRTYIQETMKSQLGIEIIPLGELD